MGGFSPPRDLFAITKNCNPDIPLMPFRFVSWQGNFYSRIAFKCSKGSIVLWLVTLLQY